MKHLQGEFEKKKKKELEDKADKKCVWAIGLAFILFIYLVATLALCAVAELDLAHAVGKGHRKRNFKKLPLSQSATPYPYLEFEKNSRVPLRNGAGI